jgi:carboxymethylenebutenolidase
MEITTSTLQLDAPDGKMDTYEARPQSGGPYPGIVVLMEAFGLNDHIKDVTRRIAQEGYVAVAPDLFHRETERLIPYSDMKKAIETMNRLQDPKVMGDVGAAIAHLKSQAAVKAGSIGVTGFCMGGRYTYLSAAHHKADVKAAVCFYGGGIPMGKPSPLERTAEINCPILLFFGGKDPIISADQVEKIKQALAEHNKNFTLHVYPDAGHGFVCDARPQSYNADAAKDAWEKFKAFFGQHLK